MLLRHHFLPDEVRRYTVELYLRVGEVRSRATILCVDRFQADPPGWSVHRKTRTFRRTDQLMNEILPDVLSLVGAPGPDGVFRCGPLGPLEGRGFHFPEEPVEPGQSWPSGSLTLQLEPLRSAELVRLGLGWNRSEGSLHGEVIFAPAKGVVLGVQALTSWSEGIGAQVLVQTRLRERCLETPQGTAREAGPTRQVLGF